MSFVTITRCATAAVRSHIQIHYMIGSEVDENMQIQVGIVTFSLAPVGIEEHREINSQWF